jgi:2-oxoglutarate dehydrogenase E1 component
MSAGAKAVSPSINSWSAEYVDSQYAAYQADPASVPEDLRSFFAGFDLANARDGTHGRAGRAGRAGSATSSDSRSAAAGDLVSAYRALGHLVANIDPFNRLRTRPAALELAHFGLTDRDLDHVIASDVFATGSGTIREALRTLESAYCGSIGVEFMHIPDDQERAWFRRKLEEPARASSISSDDRRRILEHLTSAERFESFLGKRFQGKKRFSVEGGESVVPLLKFMTQRFGELGGKEIILGMAHRGRLTVLKTYLGKDLHKLFTEFKDAWPAGESQSGGDVKYHRGYSGDQQLWGGAGAGGEAAVHLSMLNNPSHLESVNPIVMGRTRAKQDARGDASRRQYVALLIHGDAAVAGQGVVAECLNMSRLDGYDSGGTLHVVINNQVGFTTDPRDARSTEYCTDIAKMINCPVLHVNGDDPEAVVEAARLAIEYRQEFGRDVFVDLVCFRRYGHNEQDEPAYTQPGLYRLVKEHPGTAEVYRRRLIAAGQITQPEIDAMVDRESAELEAAYEAAAKSPVDPVPPPGGGAWAGFTGQYTFDLPATAVNAKTIAEVCTAMGTAPGGFNVHPKLKGLLDARRNLPTTGKLSHADAEQIAVGTLLVEGYSVRLSGQDCRRGTFTQRHAVLRDEKSDERFSPLNNVRPGKQAIYSVFDSPLSEFAVMGFDYGYSRALPKTLVMWEGQFGDFANGAQVMIDQYLASSEVKWSRWGGLVLLLPHGHEGQGPEHSSARLERFLQLCADDNMEVVYPSTGAQTFHLLRRQMLRNFRKPLIVMTPKKYLRFESSTIQELSSGKFEHLIDDAGVEAKGVKRVVYCSGKIYHELHERRSATKRQDVTIVRIEQLYPFHAELARRIDARYPKGAERVYVQEEPRNQGAFLFVADRFSEDLGIRLGYIGREASASPATGSEKAHGVQQNSILTRAIGPLPATPDSNASAIPPAKAVVNGLHAKPATPGGKANKRATP